MTTAPKTAPPAPQGALKRAWNRLADAAVKRGRVLTVANIFTQAGIIVTGGAVRLTGSGLGCSTWPQCEPGSFTPALVPETPFHAYVEFGNRLLTFVLLIVAIGVAIAVKRTRPDLKWWGYAPLVGVLAQAVVGGITVLTNLNPVAVAPHLLISMVLVWAAVQLALRYRNAPRRQGACNKRELAVFNVLTVAVVLLGTLTTGAGPHSGDAEATERLALDPALIARIHAASVWMFLVLLAWIIWRVRKDVSAGERDEVRKAWVVLLIVTLAQGLLGYVQYFTGLPELLVGTHLAGAAALIAAQSAAFYLLRRQRPVAVDA